MSADETKDDVPYGANVHEPALRVSWASLERASEESAFRSRCPKCVGGLLMVYRHPDTFGLTRHDRCIRCGQLVHYTDASIAGEQLPPDEAS
jgi:uncharacterized protein with PIN domain